MGSVITSDMNQTRKKLWESNTLDKATALLESHTPDAHVIVQNYIGNDYGSFSGEFMDSYEPRTGRAFAKIPISNAETVDLAIDSANTAFKSWSKTTRAIRSEHMRRIAGLIEQNRELFAVWESIDQGKTLERARIEVDRAVSNFSYFSTYILHEETSARMIDGVALTYEHRSPAGVFALISPWNMPLYLLTWKIAPCIAFGCTAVAKPSEVTSVSAFCEIIPPRYIYVC